MRIEKVTRYTVNGQIFETEEKARDYIDRQVNDLVTQACMNRGFTVSECIKITEAILSDRYSIADALLVQDWTND